MVQQDLVGNETPIEEFQRERPGTHLWDPELEEWRMLWEVPYDERERCLTVDDFLDEQEPEQTWGGGDFGPDDTAGQYFDVTIHKTVEYRFRIPAYEKYRAKEYAEELAWDSDPSDVYTVHSEMREAGDILFRELPEDYDPYGGEPLWEALDRVGEDGDSE